MKLKKIIIMILMIITIININNSCLAKYVIESTHKAVEIKINN